MLTKTQPTGDRKDPVVIKKYANRRLYNTDTSTYVTLDDLADMVRGERDFVVFDAKTGDDLTHSVLTQIIVEQESRTSQSLLPVPFLRQLIRFYGAGIEKLVPGYLQLSMDTFTREQERLRTQFASAFGTNLFDAYNEQVRKNLVMFEQAMTMFSPFGAAAAMGGKRSEAQKSPAEDPRPAAPSGSQPPQAPATQSDSSASGSGGKNELDELRAQLAAMQAKLERITESRG